VEPIPTARLSEMVRVEKTGRARSRCWRFIEAAEMGDRRRSDSFFRRVLTDIGQVD